MERVILHIDINHCYAQIEEMKYPELKNVAMAVGGNEASRHGIILARNLKAKAFGISTAETIREALQKCPDLLIIHPDLKEYQYYASQVKAIFEDYTDYIESFGIDEAWIDVSTSIRLFGSGEEIAKQIQTRILDEVGLTVSIGVSFNKVFAKLGSDLVKPSGLVVINRDNYQQVVWPLPVEDLLYVGRATKEKLNQMGIFTIGDLALTPVDVIHRSLHKPGSMIWSFANGIDFSDVTIKGFKQIPKSIGNSWTTPKDITCAKEAKIVLYVLAESVASRLKDVGLYGQVIHLYCRNTKLEGFTRQVKQLEETDVSEVIFKEAYRLLLLNYDFELPLRSIGISVSSLKGNGGYQLNLFSDINRLIKVKKIDETVDLIRQRFGFNAIKRLVMLEDNELSGFNPKGDHTIHPVAFTRRTL